MKLSEWVSVAQTIVEDRLRERIISFVVSKLAIFSSGPLGYILGKVAAKLAEYLADTAELKAFYRYADFRASKQGRDFMQAAIKFQQAKDEGDGEFIAKSREELINSARRFIKF